MIGGPPVLPHDRLVDSLTRLPVPDQRGLALVGDTYRGAVGRLGGCLGECALDRVDRGAPQIFRLMLDPARGREMLWEFLLCNSGDRKVGPEQDAAGRC